MRQQPVATSSSLAGRSCDPFMGSGTTLLVARQEGCRGIGIELNQDYCDMAKNRLAQDCFDFVTEETPA